MRFPAAALIVWGCISPLAGVASTAPNAATFRDPATNATCGVAGSPKDPAKTARFDPLENGLKNRTAMPARTVHSSVSEFRNLPEHPKSNRSTGDGWTQEDAQRFGALEAQAVRISGYLIGVKPESGESTNCYATDPAGIDNHLWLIDAADAKKDRSFSAVVEITPRWRQANPSWSCATLHGLIARGALFRVTGWRLYDYEHPEQMRASAPTRSTLWEIHPITKIEVATGAGWLELASPKLASATLIKTRQGATFSGSCGANDAGNDGES